MVPELLHACVQGYHASEGGKMAEGGSAGVELVKKPRAVSIVWDYFGLRADSKGVAIAEDDQKPVCRTCNKSVNRLQFLMTNIHPII